MRFLLSTRYASRRRCCCCCAVGVVVLEFLRTYVCDYHRSTRRVPPRSRTLASLRVTTAARAPTTCTRSSAIPRASVPCRSSVRRLTSLALLHCASARPCADTSGFVSTCRPGHGWSPSCSLQEHPDHRCQGGCRCQVQASQHHAVPRTFVVPPHYHNKQATLAVW